MTMETESRTLRANSCLQNGKYRILSVLGQGGFGITYLAEQTGLGMKVAIKEFFLKGSCQRDSGTSRISVPVSDNVELVGRCQKKFKSEARKIASLNNDHIINIIDVFDENGTSYYVMKYLAGGSLSDAIVAGGVSEELALRVVGDVADALGSVHNKGLLHLDIKPANILFDERGRCVLIDFGVSKYVDSQQDSSTTSSLIGYSRGFAPLEQVNSTISQLSPASDIYALGATLYCLVTGKNPPDASDVMESGLPALPAKLSDEVKNAITKAMAPRRKDRPQDVDAFLKLLPDGTPTPTSDPTIVVTKVQEESAPMPAPGKGRIPLILSAAMLAAAIVIAVVTFAFRPQTQGGSTGGGTDSAQIAELNDKVNSLTRENGDLKKQVSSLKTASGSSSELQAQVTSLQNQVNSLKSQNNKLQTDNSSLNKTIQTLQPKADKWDRYMETMNK